MDKFFALLITVYAALQVDMDSTAWLDNRFFPVVFALGFLYLFRLLPSLAALFAAISFYHTDLGSSSLFQAMGLPLIGIVCVFYFILKVGYPRGLASGGFMTGTGGEGGTDIGCGGDGGGGCD